MKIKVHFNNITEDQLYPVTLNADQLMLLTEMGDDFWPTEIENGHIATYEIREEERDGFFDALNAADWPHTEATVLDEAAPSDITSTM